MKSLLGLTAAFAAAVASFAYFADSASAACCVSRGGSYAHCTNPNYPPCPR